MKVEGGQARMRVGKSLLSVDPGFIATGQLANAFVSGGDGDDANERNEEGEGGSDVPPAEDYTEIFGVPGEEHLQLGLVIEKSRKCRRVKTHVHGTLIASHIHPHTMHAVIHMRMIHCEFQRYSILYIIELIAINEGDGDSSSRGSVRVQ
ncbi:hypothetical protein BPOR_0021g00040 [Botrytis porri]|uniref:Uncharacterized protein n=1 Tax=Botrytis porri TaxID=87229 RepID=A0A4Z1L4F1_9HELO|nr:hypothetical protein BPOR_0021g00040 [Botrytis porri]